MGVAGANIQWGHFVCPSSEVLHVRRGAKFGIEKVNDGQNICNRVASVGNGKNFEIQAQFSKVFLIRELTTKKI